MTDAIAAKAAPTSILPADWPAPANIRAFTTLRSGPGVSLPPFDHFNLGLRCGDEPAHALENRRRLRSALQLPGEPCWLQQVHGTRVVRVVASHAAADAPVHAVVDRGLRQPREDDEQPQPRLHGGVHAGSDERRRAAREARVRSDLVSCRRDQLVRGGEHVGRRTPVQHALVGDAAATLERLVPRLDRRTDRAHLETARTAYQRWHERQRSLLDPGHDDTLLGRARAVLDNPDERIRPEAVAAAVDRLAPDSTIFTSDTGMSTAWLARFVKPGGQSK